LLPPIPYLTFTFQFKLDKKGQMIEDEYEESDVVFVEKY
tara:strand:- start:241 stop:357 length:117 start_codon:yes stop_codon:yes gene_type:complete